MPECEVWWRCLERLRQVICMEGCKIFNGLKALGQQEDSQHLVHRRRQLVKQVLDLWMQPSWLDDARELPI